MKKLLSIIITLALLALTCLTPALAETQAIDISEYFTDRDLSGEWEESEAVHIRLNGAGAEADGSGVTIDGATITITAAGTYVLSGTLDNGTVIVNADDQDKVQLVLNGVAITSAGTAAIDVENADKVFITLAEGSDNTLQSSGFDEDQKVDAAIFARDTITLNGTGTLTVISTKNGIVSKDNLKIASGTYVVTAENRALDANDSVRIASGTFTLTAGKDAIRAKNEDDASKGYVIIFDGEFTISAGGGAANAPQHANDMMGFGRQASSTSEGSSSSTKGIKASGNLTILGGSFNIDAADDGLHTDSSLTITGGSFVIASGDDGMHANNALTISGGEIDITTSYEGIEGKTITISGGDIRLVASDDGVNAGGGKDSSGFGFYDMFASEDGVEIVISGGSLYVNASGDGIDSNGSITVSGGTIVVSGPTSSGDGALDCNGTATITGGSVIAAGSSGMAENFSSASGQAAALVNISGQAGDITVTDASGNVILTGTVEKSFDCVVISSPDIQVGGTYTVTTTTGSTEVTITDSITGSGTGFGGMGQGGFGGGNPGGMGQGGMGGFGGNRGGRGGH